MCNEIHNKPNMKQCCPPKKKFSCIEVPYPWHGQCPLVFLPKKEGV